MNTTSKTNPDFSAVHRSLQDYIERDLLVMASSVILRGQQIIDFHMTGYQDREEEIPLAEDSIFRIFSNTKLITNVAAMMLWEEGAFSLEDKLYEYIPEFKNLVVLKKGSTDPTETEPLQQHATIKNLLTHTAGFSYGLFQESPVDLLYVGNGILSPKYTVEEMVSQLSQIPLANQPGFRWQYSVGVDVLGRLIEIWSGMSFGDFLRERIFKPLNMTDTDFYVPPEKANRFCAIYDPADMLDPMVPGLNLGTDGLVGGYLPGKPFESGGGGLVSTISDYTKFMQMLMGEGTLGDVTLLKPDTLRMMHTNQLEPGISVQLPNWEMPNTKFGFGFAIKESPMAGEPDAAIGEFHWGGLAGTHTWISPRLGIAALVFTQRMFGFWHPFSHEYKRLVYEALT
ncbi:MAG: serine hydrolase [Gammaproteobacteria bacterium]|nr:serine hydrolase [Gammaproteobacteria bacterium]